MSNKLTIKIRNESRADEAIDAFTKLAADAVRKTAEQAVAVAKALAPVRTGHLRDSITIAEISETEIIFGATAEYAPYVEMGTAHEAPHSFVSPAAYDARDKLVVNLTKT